MFSVTLTVTYPAQRSLHLSQLIFPQLDTSIIHILDGPRSVWVSTLEIIALHKRCIGLLRVSVLSIRPVHHGKAVCQGDVEFEEGLATTAVNTTAVAPEQPHYSEDTVLTYFFLDRPG
jgi:hypothetical protein